MAFVSRIGLLLNKTSQGCSNQFFITTNYLDISFVSIIFLDSWCWIETWDSKSSACLIRKLDLFYIAIVFCKAITIFIKEFTNFVTLVYSCQKNLMYCLRKFPVIPIGVIHKPCGQIFGHFDPPPPFVDNFT